MTDLIVFRALHPSAVVLLYFFPLVFLPGRKMVLVILYLNSVVKGHNIHIHRLLVRRGYMTVLKATAQHLRSELS